MMLAAFEIILFILIVLNIYYYSEKEKDYQVAWFIMILLIFITVMSIKYEIINITKLN